MRLKCISNSSSILPEDCYNPITSSVGPSGNVAFKGIEEKKEYVVYALMFHKCYPWYFIEEYGDIPGWAPAPLFNVVDGRISRYWKYHCNCGNNQNTTDVVFSFEEWLDNEYYYDYLIDGREKEKEIFKRYKKLMDIEFPDPSIEKKAIDAGDEWIICPDCDESWHHNSSNGMVHCPKCSIILHNPLYGKIVEIKS